VLSPKPQITICVTSFGTAHEALHRAVVIAGFFVVLSGVLAVLLAADRR
jgi:hypothetical protein